jgi:hypothetical protein
MTKPTAERIKNALALLKAIEDIDVSASRTLPMIAYHTGGFVAGRGGFVVARNEEADGQGHGLDLQAAILRLANLCRH